MRDSSRSAFTLVEALASVVLISIGLVAGQQCLGSLSKARVRFLDGERMHRLAFRKYDEVLAEGKLLSGQTSGDFAGLGESGVTWRADRTPTGIGNLDVLRIQVANSGERYDQGVEVQGLVCRPKKEAQ